jgi:hypothetical protein
MIKMHGHTTLKNVEFLLAFNRVRKYYISEVTAIYSIHSVTIEVPKYDYANFRYKNTPKSPDI